MASDPSEGTDEAELVRYAGAAESGSEHPIARAVSAHATQVVGRLPAPEDLQSTPGQGVTATIAGRELKVGRRDWVAGPNCTGFELSGPSRAETHKIGRNSEHGLTEVAVGWDGVYRGSIYVADQVKDTSAEAVSRFRALGLTPVLLTGDNQDAAESVAAQVGIERVIAGVLPDGKVAAITDLQRDGRTVAMVGDGVNDSAALAQADLGIALGTGTDAAIQAADLTLMRGDLMVAADAIRLSRATLARIRGNLFWAFAYNVAAIPLAALGFLNPMIAGAAMAFSSVFVVLNSLRLRAFRPLA